LGGLLQHRAYMYKPETIIGTPPKSHFGAERAAAAMLSNCLETIVGSVELHARELCELFRENLGSVEHDGTRPMSHFSVGRAAAAMHCPTALK
jgi:predicted class III extradiol MEMO1 family dioxygenase